MQLVFLGCGDGYGVPRLGCECALCQKALMPESRNRRTGPSVALRYGPSYAERVVLIDAAPELRLQTMSVGIYRFDALLVTHCHDNHILGLSTLIKAQREASPPLPIYAPAQVLDGCRERFCHLWTEKTYRRLMQPQTVESSVDLWGLEAHSLRVDHGIGGTAFGYLLNIGRRRLAYVSDMLRATTEVRQALSGLDLLVLGASHYYDGTEVWKRSVMDIMAAQELIREVEPARAILTHLSHTVDYDELSSKLPSGICLAYDGLIVEVQE
jgi:phosphoribosyl 1,2-cyclic phosphate phosphodiesterase